ncbi:MAG TPA: hypothetical protein VJP89_21520 [Pyrinomonadaceae bacterium]|nr:hypothetical protein [Pyrinomonadaceae bacterium]
MYSIRLADHLAENQQDEKQHKQHGGNQQEAQTRIGRSLIDHDVGNVSDLFDPFLDVFSDAGFGGCSWSKSVTDLIVDLLPALRTKGRVVAERDTTVRATA